MTQPVSGGEKRFVKTAVWLSLVLAALLIAGVWLYASHRPQLLSRAAKDAAFARDYDQLETCLADLEQEDERLYYDTVLSVADIADFNGDWETAAEILETRLHIAGSESDVYADFEQKAKAQLPKFVYHQAMNLYEQGAYAKASSLAATISDYEPARMLYQLSYDALIASQPTPTPTPSPTSSPVPTPSPTPTPEPPPQVTQEAATPATETPTPAPTPSPTPAPTLLPEGRLATGYHHTVVLRDDGTVLAYGDNSYGQTDVAQWQQVVAVVAGAYHTVALTGDGRVLATGDNTYGQTDVEMFRGVKQIAASAWNTYLLLESGQIMSIGYRNDDFALELASVEQIAAGSYGLLARAQGTNHASHPGLVLDDRCRQFSVSRGYAIGVDDQGKTLCTLDQVPTWDRIARVSAGENAVLALTEDGQVQSHVFGSHVSCSFDFGQPVLAISAGPNHYAFVLQDGSIEIRYADGTVETPEQRIW